jgi:prepilin-type N-terminal cleavage/methylation domain-containing protein
MPRRPAFTLVELLVAVSILGVTFAVAIPRFRGALDGIATRGAASDAAAMLALARQIALTRSVRSTLTIDTGTAVISIRAGPTLVQSRDERALHGVRLSASRTSVTYTQLGTALGVSNLTLVATRGARAETLTVSRLGRVRRAGD